MTGVFISMSGVWHCCSCGRAACLDFKKCREFEMVRVPDGILFVVDEKKR